MPSFAPIRHRWRLITAAILLLTLISLWCIWFAIAHHRLTSRLTVFQSSGETLDRKQLIWHPEPTTLSSITPSRRRQRASHRTKSHAQLR